MRIFLLLPSLEAGGCERQVTYLADGLQRLGHEVAVGVASAGGTFEDDVVRLGIPVINLAKRGLWNYPFFAAATVRAIRGFNPDAVYSFMGSSNVLAAALKRFFPKSALVWGVRASAMGKDRDTWRSVVMDRLEVLLSGTPSLVISNSRAGAADAVAKGFPEASMRVVHNGIDTERFKPDTAARRELRAVWELEDRVVVGVPARLDPMKGHSVFLRALEDIRQRVPSSAFVCVGTGPSGYAEDLRRQEKRLNLSEGVLWAGLHEDMPAVYNALDICCLPSVYGEGFPNVIGEAMAVGKPCVVTDVGDAALVVGDVGRVVPPGDSGALAEGLCAAVRKLGNEGEGMAEAARNRVISEFGIARMAERTARLLSGLLPSPPP